MAGVVCWVFRTHAGPNGASYEIGYYSPYKDYCVSCVTPDLQEAIRIVARLNGGSA